MNWYDNYDFGDLDFSVTKFGYDFCNNKDVLIIYYDRENATIIESNDVKATIIRALHGDQGKAYADILKAGGGYDECFKCWSEQRMIEEGTNIKKGKYIFNPTALFDANKEALSFEINGEETKVLGIDIVRSQLDDRFIVDEVHEDKEVMNYSDIWVQTTGRMNRVDLTGSKPDGVQFSCDKSKIIPNQTIVSKAQNEREYYLNLSNAMWVDISAFEVFKNPPIILNKQNGGKCTVRFEENNDKVLLQFNRENFDKDKELYKFLTDQEFNGTYDVLMNKLDNLPIIKELLSAIEGWKNGKV